MHYPRLSLFALIWLLLFIASGVLPLWAEDAPLPAALARLEDDNPLVRVKAAAELGACGDRRVVPQLIAALKDEFSIVRGAAATALGKLHDKQAVDALIAVARDADSGIMIRAVEALGNLGDARAVGVLTAALKTPDAPELRVAAITALSKIPAPQSATALLGVLTDPAHVHSHRRHHRPGSTARPCRKHGAGGATARCRPDRARNHHQRLAQNACAGAERRTE